MRAPWPRPSRPLLCPSAAAGGLPALVSFFRVMCKPVQLTPGGGNNRLVSGGRESRAGGCARGGPREERLADPRRAPRLAHALSTGTEPSAAVRRKFYISCLAGCSAGAADVRQGADDVTVEGGGASHERHRSGGGGSLTHSLARAHVNADVSYGKVSHRHAIEESHRCCSERRLLRAL
jgi:hypothetical protein